MGLFTSKWNHKDPQVRLTAFNTLQTADDFLKVALKCKFYDTAEMAFNKISQQAEYYVLAQSANLPEIKDQALKKITEKKYLIALIPRVNDEKAINIISIIEDSETLNKIFSEDISNELMEKIIEETNTPQIIEAIALNCKVWKLAPKIIEKVTDHTVLKNIAAKSVNTETRGAALKKIDDEAFLIFTIYNDPKWFIRNIAMGKIINQNIFYNMLLDFSWVHDADDILLFATICNKITDQDLQNRVYQELNGSAEFEELKSMVSHSPEIVEVLDNFVNNAGQNQLVVNVLGNSNRFKETAIALYSNDQDLLQKIINESEDYNLRQNACKNISDQSKMASIALNHEDEYVRKELVKKIYDNKILLEFIEKESEDTNKWIAAKNISDAEMIINLAKNNEDEQIRNIAIGKIDDQEILKDIVRSDKDAFVRESAILKITDTSFFIEMLLSENEEEVIYALLDKIDNRNELNVIIDSTENDLVKNAANLKLLNNPELIENIKKIENKELKSWAISILPDDKLILDILLNEEDEELIKKVSYLLKNEETLFQLYEKDKLKDIPSYSYEEVISSDDIILKILEKSKDQFIRQGWIQKISDKELLKKTIVNEESSMNQETGIRCLESQSDIVEMLVNDNINLAFPDFVIVRITDSSLLQKLENELNNELLKLKVTSWRNAYSELMESGVIGEVKKENVDNLEKISFKELSQNELNLIGTLKSEAITGLTSENIEYLSPDLSDAQKSVIEKLNTRSVDQLVLIQKNIMRGIELANNKEYEKAIESYEKAIDIADWHFVGIKSVGSCYYYLNDFSIALNYMKKAYELNNSDSNVVTNLVEIQKKIYE